MVAIFSKVTCILSHQFVKCLPVEKLAERLTQLGKDGGLEFNHVNKDSKTISIAGEWGVILKAHQSLETYYNENKYIDGKYSTDPVDANKRDLTSNKEIIKQEQLPPICVDSNNKALRNDQVVESNATFGETTPTSSVKVINKVNACGKDVFTIDCHDDSSTDIDFDENVLLKDYSTKSASNETSVYLSKESTKKVQIKIEKNPSDPVVKYERGFSVNEEIIKQEQISPSYVESRNAPFENKNVIESNAIFEEKIPKSTVKEIINVNACNTDLFTNDYHDESSTDIDFDENVLLKDHSTKSSSKTKSDYLLNESAKKMQIKIEQDAQFQDVKETTLRRENIELNDDIKSHMETEDKILIDDNVDINQEAVVIKEKEVCCDLRDYKGTKGNLREHKQQKHSNKFKFKCSICPKRFKVSRSVTQHEKTVHQDTAHYCELCKKYFKTKRYYDFHLTTHDEEYVKLRFTCEACPKSFSTKYVLNAHIQAKHIEMKKIVCPTNSKVTDAAEDTNKDVKKKTEIENKGNELSYGQRKMGKTITNMKENEIHRRLPKYSCNKCNEKVLSKRDFRYHMKFAHEVSNDDIDKILEQSDVIIKVELSCELCDYKGQKQNLKNHIQRKHSKQVKFQCSVCQKGFNLKNDKTRHEKTVHVDPVHALTLDTYSCVVCKKDYKSKKRYNFHLTTHKEDYVKPTIRCESCPKTFTNKYVLNRHVRQEHLGMKKSYMCPTCGKNFSSRTSYLRHAAIHAGIKIPRNHVCDICGKSFEYKDKLRSHLVVHEKTSCFTCPICFKAFKDKNRLHTHSLKHQDKTHLCTTCGKGFSQRGSLERHERIHSGIKPFECGICHKPFRDYSIVRRHLILTHKKDPKFWQADMISHVEKKSILKTESGIGEDGEEMNQEKEIAAPIEIYNSSLFNHPNPSSAF